MSIENEINQWKRRLRAQPGLEDGDIEELESHLREHVARQVRQGVDEETALKNAFREIGDTRSMGREYTALHTKESRRGGLGLVRNYVSIARRHLWRNPGYTVLNVGGLAVAMACALLTLIWIRYEYSFDTQNSHFDSIYKVYTHMSGASEVQTYPMASNSLYLSSLPQVEAATRVSTGPRWPHRMCFRPENDPTACVYEDGIYADSLFFEVFDVPVFTGRPVAVKQPGDVAISESLALALYGTTDAVGKALNFDMLSGIQVTAVFRDLPPNVTMPYHFVAHQQVRQRLNGISDENYRHFYLDTYIRTSEPLSSIDSLLNSATVKDPVQNSESLRISAVPLADLRLNAQFVDGNRVGGRIIYVRIFAMVALLILVVAAINFVNLSTARATMRGKEIGIRKLCGAYKSNLIVQFIGETFLLVSLSAALALAVVYFAAPHLHVFTGEPMDLVWFDFTFAAQLGVAVLLISVLAGLYPALIQSSFLPVHLLKKQPGATAHGSTWVRKTLLGMQLGITIVVVVFSLTVYRQLAYVNEMNLGLDRGNIVRIEPTANLQRQYETWKTEMMKDPSIVAATSSSGNPLDLGIYKNAVKWPGGQELEMNTIAVNNDFFDTFGIRILEGPTPQPHVDDGPQQLYINEKAREVMGLADPVGAKLTIHDSEFTVAGVVADFHTQSVHHAIEPLLLWISPPQNHSYLFVRYREGTTASSLATIEAAYDAIEPSYTMQYWFQDEVFDSLYKTDRMAQYIMAVLTFVILVIAVVGLAGLATHNMSRRLKELGVRRVFGASSADLIGLLSSDFFRLVAVAALFALPLAWFASDRWLEYFAYRIGTPWWVYVAVVVGMVALSAAIVFSLCYRTVRLNPTVTLRHE